MIHFRLLRFGLLLASSACLLSAQTPSKEAIEKIVREYLLEHPEVLMESLRSFQEKSRAAEAMKARESIATRKAELVKDEITPVAGNAASEVTLTFFFDYRCGYCKKVTADLEPFTQAGSPVRVVFKELPILGPESEVASRAALAAARQNAYLPFHKALMAHQGAFTIDAFEEIARTLKLDVTKWQQDLAADEVSRVIRANQELASAIGVQATPSFVAGSELAPGAMTAEGFKALIERAKAPTPTVAAAAK